MNTFRLSLSNFYKDNQDWVWLVLQWFLLAMVLGGITFFVRPSLITDILNIYQDKFGDDPARDLHLAQEIFIRNSTVCLIALLGGVLLGISSFIIVFFNGFIIGFVMLTIVALPGNPLRNILYLILGLVPHGIFELPAFFIASTIGLRLGTEWIGKFSQGKRWEIFKQNIRRTIKVVPVLVILLAVAAIIEVFVSGYFVGNF
jgi:stage II sporulation protein M